MDVFSLFSSSLDELLGLSSDYAVYWAPFLFGFFFLQAWYYYVRSDYISKIKWIMFEIHIPKETYKPLQAMEVVLNAFDQPSQGTAFERFWTGRVRLWFSFEIVSTEGALRYYIRFAPKFKEIIQSRIYSQYPDAEITEVPDYTEAFWYTKGGKIEIHGAEYKLTKSDAYPIKTYVDYGMDREFNDEKQRIDPMSGMIEFLGSVGKGEHAWMQIIIRSATKRFVKPDGTLGDWKDEAKLEVKKLTEAPKDPNVAKEALPPFLRLTKTQQENIAAIERNMAKSGFDCGIRILYLADREKFNKGHISHIMSAFKQFNSSELNGFKATRETSYDYPWDKLDENWMNDWRVYIFRKRKIFKAYRYRSYFWQPYKRDPFVLSSEELATIFHFPSAITETPTLRRLESKKSEPPTNLPV